MKQPLLTRRSVEIAAWLLGAILLYAAFDKLVNYRVFIRTLADYPVLNHSAATLLGPAVLGVEAAVGAALLFRSARHAAALVASLLFFLFGLIIGVAGHLQLDLNCGCWFTLPAPPSPRLHVALNVLLAVGSILVWHHSRPWPHSRQSGDTV